MSQKDIPERGGGVRIAAQLTRIKEVLNKQGEVVKSEVIKPGEARKPQTIQKISERLR